MTDDFGDLPPKSKNRCSDDLAIPLGTVTMDHRGWQWVFCGWATNTEGLEVYFVRELQEGERISLATPWTYFCSFTETLLKRFPDLARFRKGKNST